MGDDSISSINDQLAVSICAQVVEEYHQLTPDTVLVHFLFSVPLRLPVSFATPLVSLRWVLRFEFTLQCRVQSSTPPQRMTWLLPVLVRPPGL